MSDKFEYAPEVKDIADELIPKYHHHIEEYEITVKYIFLLDKTPKKGGKEVWASCRKITNLNAFLAGDDDNDEPFFVITVSKSIWDILPPDERKALIDHELCHIHAELGEDKEGEPVVKTSLKPHDLEEFTSIVRRWGLWRDDIKDFIESAQKGVSEG